MLKEKIKKYLVEILAIILLIMLLLSLGFNYKGSAKARRITAEVSTAAVSFDPNYKCSPNNIEYYCFSVTDSKKTCYTLPDKQGGKRCLIEPYWEEIIPSDEPIIKESTHKCGVIEKYCYSVSSTKKTCYTELNNTGGKRCFIEPYWKKIDDCPECLIPSICPVVNLTCPPCIQTCDGCGGGGSCSPCPPEKICDECICDDIIVLAYTDNGKEFCTGIGPGQTCINERDLTEKELDELGW